MAKVDLKAITIEEWQTLQAELVQILKDAAVELLQGAQEDLARYADQIAFDVLRVLRDLEGDEQAKRLAELKAQAQWIGEMQRIRATNEAWKTFSAILAGVTRTFTAILTNIPIAAIVAKV